MKFIVRGYEDFFAEVALLDHAGNLSAESINNERLAYLTNIDANELGDLLITLVEHADALDFLVSLQEEDEDAESTD